jgi:hypothetical protein
MVCTVGAVAPSARFIRFKLRVSQVQTRVQFVDAETRSLKRETSKRPNSFIKLLCLCSYVH